MRAWVDTGARIVGSLQSKTTQPVSRPIQRHQRVNADSCYWSLANGLEGAVRRFVHVHVCIHVHLCILQEYTCLCLKPTHDSITMQSLAVEIKQGGEMGVT